MQLVVGARVAGADHQQVVAAEGGERAGRRGLHQAAGGRQLGARPQLLAGVGVDRVDAAVLRAEEGHLGGARRAAIGTIGGRAWAGPFIAIGCQPAGQVPVPAVSIECSTRSLATP